MWQRCQCLTADAFMDHLNSTLLPWTRLTSLGRFVLPDGTPAPFLCCDSLTCSAALMQLCHAERAHSLIPCLLTSHGQGSRRQGWLPSSGTGLLQGHCPSLLLKSWDELRGSLLPGLLGSLLHLGPCLSCKGFGWKLVQPLAPHISLGSFIFPCITPWHQKMCLQSSVEDCDNDFVGGRVCWCWVYLASKLSSLNTAPQKQSHGEIPHQQKLKEAPCLHWVFMRMTEGDTCGKCVAIFLQKHLSCKGPGNFMYS